MVIGKNYKQKGIANGPIEKIADIDDNYVFFESGSRAKNNNFSSLWESVSDGLKHEVSSNISELNIIDFSSIEEQARLARLNTLTASIMNMEIPNERPIDMVRDDTISYTEVSPATVDTDTMTKARLFSLKNEIPESKFKREPLSEFDKSLENITEEDKPENIDIISDYNRKEDKKAEDKKSQHTFLNKIKRNRAFNMTIIIPKLLPDPNFIRLMIDNSDEPIIDTLTEEIYSEILKDSELIKMEVKEQIEKYIYGRPSKLSVSKPKTQPKKKIVTKK